MQKQQHSFEYRKLVKSVNRFRVEDGDAVRCTLIIPEETLGEVTDCPDADF